MSIIGKQEEEEEKKRYPNLSSNICFIFIKLNQIICFFLFVKATVYTVSRLTRLTILR